MKLIDLTGMRFGRLLVLNRGENIDGHPGWNCICDCGNTTHVLGKYLKNGKTQSCGCLHKEQLIQRSTTHGLYYTRQYGIWIEMKERCLNPSHPAYNLYGGRGISICSEWMNFQNFYDWANNHGYSNDLSIDRIDVNGNYCPDNCIWVDQRTQCNNKRTNIRISNNGEDKTLAEWARFYGIDYQKLYRNVILKKIPFEEYVSKIKEE